MKNLYNSKAVKAATLSAVLVLGAGTMAACSSSSDSASSDSSSSAAQDANASNSDSSSGDSSNASDSASSSDNASGGQLGRPNSCNLPGTYRDVMSEEITGLKWKGATEKNKRVQSERDGFCKDSDEKLAAGYADSQTGVVLAAANFIKTVRSGEDFTDEQKNQLASAEIYDKAVDEASAEVEKQEDSTKSPSERKLKKAKIKGYNLVSAPSNGSDATVQILVDQDNEEVAYEMNYTWADQTWKANSVPTVVPSYQPDVFVELKEPAL